MPYTKFRESIHSNKHKAVRNFLIERRKELGLSQQVLADRLNVIYSLIGKIETGDRRLDIVELVDYYNALEIEPCDILKLINQVN